MRFNIEKKFIWGVERCIARFFQFTGNCGKRKCIHTVQACNLDEACRKLKAGKISNFIITKVEMFPQRATNPNLIDPTTAKNVTPTFRKCVDCCDLLPHRKKKSKKSPKKALLPKEAFSLIEPPLLQETIMPQVGLSRKHKPKPGDFIYYGSGTVLLSGSAPIQSLNQGVLPINFNFSETISNFSTPAPLPTAHVPQLVRPQVLDKVSEPCCKAPIPVSLELFHTVDLIAPLSRFLKVNKLVLHGSISKIKGNTKLEWPKRRIIKKIQNNLPEGFLKLNYIKGERGNWQANVYLTGLAPAGYPESWGIAFTFGCHNENWKFALTVANTQPNQRYVSRLILDYKKSIVCPQVTIWNGFNFIVDPDKATSTPKVAQPMVISDNAGFFRNLQMQFSILPENRTGIGAPFNQFEQNNTKPYDQTLTSGEL